MKYYDREKDKNKPREGAKGGEVGREKKEKKQKDKVGLVQIGSIKDDQRHASGDHHPKAGSKPESEVKS